MIVTHLGWQAPEAAVGKMQKEKMSHSEVKRDENIFIYVMLCPHKRSYHCSVAI